MGSTSSPWQGLLAARATLALACVLVLGALAVLAPLPLAGAAWADDAPAEPSDGAGAAAADVAAESVADAIAYADDVWVSPLEITPVPDPLPAGAGETSRDYSSMNLQELTAEVQAMGAQRDALTAQRDSLTALVTQVGEKQADVSRRLSYIEHLADEAVISRYKLQRHGVDLIDALLGAADLPTFFSHIKYLEATIRVDTARVLQLRDQVLACEQAAAEYQAAAEALDGRIATVNANLEKVDALREEKQKLADLVAATRLVPDGADWAAGEEKFIEEWAPRVDAYLAGSPMAGQGKAFAKAAWDNRIDPRWSAAISTKESSKGRLCIRPHNAWGWGAADSDPYNLASEWATWEDAINAHAAGLARGYGYTVSVEGAQSYCPPNWEDWYVTVVNEMNRI